jgi:hypothetical protein
MRKMGNAMEENEPLSYRKTPVIEPKMNVATRTGNLVVCLLKYF